MVSTVFLTDSGVSLKPSLLRELGMFIKKVGFITTLAAIFMLTATPAKAQEENGFKKFNVREDFRSPEPQDI